MKKNMFMPALLVVVLFSACNGDGESSNGSTDTTVSTTYESTIDTVNMNNTGIATNTNSTHLQGQDSTFVLEAASGGMMEVEAGNLAQQNATNPRVKNFGAMMVRDHSKANQELKSFAASRNFALPDSMMTKHKKHIDMMRKMNGKAFDKHYMEMMVRDHNEDVQKFQRAANSATDADLKGWAAKTLPVLQMHRDSAQAINKSKM